MAKLSLQEQLLKSGLVSSGKAKTVKAEKRKEQKQQQHQRVEPIDEAKQQVQQAKAEQAEKDRLLNWQKAQELEKKAIAAQIKQLIDDNKQAQDPHSDLTYHFTDGALVKKLYVNQAMRDNLVRGRLAIVKLGKRYEVVSTDVAEKIRLRDANAVLVLNQNAAPQAVENDPYAAYQIPDDLIW
jgi:uncharacterized protein YaiL (DUF2058 family)